MLLHLWLIFLFLFLLLFLVLVLLLFLLYLSFQAFSWHGDPTVHEFVTRMMREVRFYSWFWTIIFFFRHIDFYICYGYSGLCSSLHDASSLAFRGWAPWSAQGGKILFLILDDIFFLLLLTLMIDFYICYFWLSIKVFCYKWERCLTSVLYFWKQLVVWQVQASNFNASKLVSTGSLSAYFKRWKKH